MSEPFKNNHAILGALCLIFNEQELEQVMEMVEYTQRTSGANVDSQDIVRASVRALHKSMKEAGDL